jgi:Holliday junction resolvase
LLEFNTSSKIKIKVEKNKIISIIKWASNILSSPIDIFDLKDYIDKIK